jgi:hypothetical protein
MGRGKQDGLVLPQHPLNFVRASDRAFEVLKQSAEVPFEEIVLLEEERECRLSRRGQVRVRLPNGGIQYLNDGMRHIAGECLWTFGYGGGHRKVQDVHGCVGSCVRCRHQRVNDFRELAHRVLFVVGIHD